MLSRDIFKHNSRCFFLIFCVILSSSLWSEPEEKSDPKKLCLNMIVKNESQVITRCLESVKPIIDYWVIVDTGSTDNTQTIIKEYLKDIPGELHERSWQNFEHNRNEALNLAKGKAQYLLFMDADDMLVMSKDYVFPKLDMDSYYVEIADAGSKYSRRIIAKNDLNWRWVGVIHEYLDSPQVKREGIIAGLTYKRTNDGARSQDPEKYKKDAQVLEAALEKDPKNDRYVFYLAQSYGDAGMNEEAVEAYERRIAMGGWDQEVFWSMLKVGNLKIKMDKPQPEIVDSYLRAILYRPSRAEPWFYLANLYRSNGHFHAGFYAAQQGAKIPLSNDLLFVEKWIYDYGLPLELSICAYWIGKYVEAKKVSEELLAKPDLPQNFRDCIETNMKWINTQLALEKIKAKP